MARPFVYSNPTAFDSMMSSDQAPTPDQEQPSPPQSARARRVPLSNLQIILIALTIVGLRLVFDFSQRIIEGQQKVTEQRDLEAEIEELLQERRDLEADKAYFGSPSFIEAWAHNEGKMVRDGEKLVVPIYASPPEQPQQTSQQLDEAQPIPFWHVWWTLFFDTNPPLSEVTP